MDRIAIISDVHANITALNAVLDDIHSRGISRIFCLGDSVTKCCNPDLVIDKLKENCEVVLRGNCDESISSPNAKLKSFWSRVKIGEERANYPPVPHPVGDTAMGKHRSGNRSLGALLVPSPLPSLGPASGQGPDELPDHPRGKHPAGRRGVSRSMDGDGTSGGGDGLSGHCL